MPSNRNEAPSTLVAAIFQRHEVERLAQIRRFLTGVAEPQIAPIAARVGYNAGEHEFGWTNLNVAQGSDLPFEYHLSEAQQWVVREASSAQVARYRELDQFENKWFPRMRAAIQRFMEPDQRAIFEAAFFADLGQQPMGPALVTSVETFLNRLTETATSTVPGVKETVASLRQKGLTEELLAKMRLCVEECKKEGSVAPSPLVDPAVIAASARERRAAYDRVNRWFIDWGATLRSELSYQQRVHLGLSERKRSKKTKKAAQET